MFLEISNIGKIQKAAVEMRGITMIAGDNNTGKSTYGKILYCMFNAFCNAKTAVYEERKQNIKDIIFTFFRRYHYPLGDFINSIMEHQSSAEELRGIFKEAIDNKIITENKISNSIRIFNSVNNNAGKEIRIVDRDKDYAINSAIEKIVRSGGVTDEQIQKTRLARFLRTEFEEQIVHVNHTEDTGTISLTIKGNTLSVFIRNNECIDFTDNVGIVYNALYIDTPFILDELNIHPQPQRIGHRDHLLRNLSKPSDDISIFDEIITKQQFQRVLSNINTVVDGEFIQADGDWNFQVDGLNAPLGMFNISAGMKPFLIIKRLLEAGSIKEGGILVFDEPEIHLHPEWQLKYAELLVLLQKELYLNILLTTHSPYFLNAIEVYSQKHGVSSRCNYYLTDTAGDACTVNEVTDHLDLVYQKLAKPFQDLENLRYMET